MNITKDAADRITKLRNYPSVYINETPIIQIGGASVLMHEIALAGLLAELNMVFIGRSGPGKSQLIADIKNGIFNGEAVHLRGSADLRVRPIYCAIDMELYKQGRADEAVQPRRAASRMLHIMEEFNRAPPVVANEWLGISDGVLDIDGTQILLGKGYRVAIGAANVGNGEFSGTFQTDNALKERLVLALDFDGMNLPRELDYFTIFENSCNPRVVQSDPQSNVDLLLEAHREVSGLAASAAYFVRMMQLYLVKGLDEVVIGNKTSSKQDIHNLASQVDQDKDAKKDLLNYATSPSVRAAKVFGAIAPSLAAVALSKGAQGNVLEDSCFSALELILPFSDSLPNKILTNNNGSRRKAAKEMVSLIRKDMPSSEILYEGLRKASEGKLKAEDTTQLEKPRIRCFSRFLKQVNEQAAKPKERRQKA
ncbi:hypothetical protein JXA56_03305 [Candidatus Micrarchaeota archaeon]|nr:hypothetical protein [Candidatus Micrarchaeota archaeon]